ncbi:hypothetical protein TREMEDRAFT_60861 [Tremella mesenterica DSM 1558]|uniref:uncharacterized protein n=1 Tax=Tremella mesenterica (strain ATCC 24925 / CBS 8224 / DSM 1558 / NBRC 9311 / NRRL Y-6157 / RJB 2259-6 / UBC 559-6) TaxID=578456 RepID=UPI0003F493CF|nr:uncharacterized protein TREMEDRAFT_60861 [Tremella mesenterica DSM 1558]EIW70368.1 hypothetical protein TREMEDRAFT_60861 [Tremella mesenterica DSM 1558]
MSLSTTNSSTSRSYTTSLLPTNEEWKEMTRRNHSDSEGSIKALYSIINIISTILEKEKMTGALGKLIEEEKSINDSYDNSQNTSSSSTPSSTTSLIDHISEQSPPNEVQIVDNISSESPSNDSASDNDNSTEDENSTDDPHSPIYLEDFLDYIQNRHQSQIQVNSHLSYTTLKEVSRTRVIPTIEELGDKLSDKVKEDIIHCLTIFVADLKLYETRNGIGLREEDSNMYEIPSKGEMKEEKLDRIMEEVWWQKKEKFEELFEEGTYLRMARVGE